MLDWFPSDAVVSCWAAIALFLAGWAGCCGWAMRVARDARPAEALAYGFALWTLAIPAAATVLCVAGLFRPWLFVALPLAFALAGLPWFARRIADWRASAANAMRDPLCCFAVAGVAAFLAWGANFNLTYPSTAWDTASYHRPVAAFLLQQGTLGRYPTSNWQANHFARDSEYVAAWTIAVARFDGPARLIPLFAMAAMAAAIHAALRSWGTPRAMAACAAAASFGVPAMVCSALRDYGDVDVHFGAIAAIATAAISAAAQRDRFAAGHAYATAVALALLPGIKTTGLLHAAVLGGALLFALGARRAGWGVVLRGVTLCAALFAVASSSWMVVNARDSGNPLFPMPVVVGGKLLLKGFEWIEPGNFDSFLGVPDELKTLGLWERVAFSALALRIGDATVGFHFGGWGHHVVFAAAPLFAVGFVAALARRRWTLAVLMAAHAVAWIATPHNWWARLCFPLVTALPLGVAAIAPLLRTEGLRNAIAAAYLLLAMPSAIVTAQHLWHGRSPAAVAREAAANGRTWAIPQDGFMPDGDPQGLRDAYRWLGNNLPAGARLGYDRTNTHGYPGMCFRPDFASTLHEIDAATSDLAPYDYLAVPASRADIARERGFDGTVVFSNHAYTILHRPASTTKPEP